MPEQYSGTDLKNQHHHSEVAKRLEKASKPDYLRDIIYGAIDGAVTTFAIVAGVAGAGLSSGIVLILGLSNLIADGFSMATGCYLGLKAEIDVRNATEADELRQINEYPEGEREEVRQIYANLGFSGEDLEKVVNTITADKKRWLDTMIMHEFGLPLASPNPAVAGFLTFVSFVIVGTIPLAAYIFDYFYPGIVSSGFFYACILAGIGFFSVGSLKSIFTAKSWFTSGLETLFIGGFAAAVAYGIGAFLQELAVPVG